MLPMYIKFFTFVTLLLECSKKLGQARDCLYKSNDTVTFCYFRFLVLECK